MTPAPGKTAGTPLVIGLDCSTGSSKVLAVDRTGRRPAKAQVAIPLSSPLPGYYEQNPDDWWRSATRALRMITRRLDPRRIVALAIANQRETFVPLSRAGAPLRPAIIWLDERCKDEVEAFSRKVGRKRIHRITGKPVDYAPVVYRLAWMKRHERTLFDRIDMVCDVHAYVARKLTGFYATSWASADPLGLLDLHSKKWSPVILRALGLEERQLPALHRPGTIIGRISGVASGRTGLGTHTVVVAGGGDGQAAGLGTGVLTPNRAYLNLGTAVVAGVYGSRYRTSSAFRTISSCSESGYYYECSLRAGTFALDWFIREILEIDPLKSPGIYRELEREARRVPAGSDGLLFLPYLCGAMNPYWDAGARGAFVGLTSSHRRGHLYRSILEGIAFEQRLALNAVEEEIGTRIGELVVIGGGAGSELWCRIFADVTGKTIHRPRNADASGLGAAVAAAVGAGWYASFREAARAMTGAAKNVEPDKRATVEYRRRFRIYKELYPALRFTL